MSVEPTEEEIKIAQTIIGDYVINVGNGNYSVNDLANDFSFLKLCITRSLSAQRESYEKWIAELEKERKGLKNSLVKNESFRNQTLLNQIKSLREAGEELAVASTELEKQAALSQWEKASGEGK